MFPQKCSYSPMLHLAPSLQIIVMLVLMVIMVVLLVIDKIRSDIVALGVLVVLGLLQFLPEDKLFSGFSNNAVISILAVMMLGAGLEKTGMVSDVARLTLKLSGGRERSVVAWLTLISGIMAGFLRSLGAFALLLPVINRLSLYLHIPRSKLMMPVGFCAIAGGTLTLIGSGPLIVLNGIMEGYSHGHDWHTIKPVSLFEMFPIGLCILLIMVLFFVWFGPRLLPKKEDEELHFGADLQHFQKTYGFGGEFHEVEVLPDSELCAHKLKELEALLEVQHIALVGISNGREILLPPLRKTRLAPSARLALVGHLTDVKAFADSHGLGYEPRLDVFADILNPMRSGFSEVVIPPGSALIGKVLRELHMRMHHQVQVLSLFRGNQFYTGREMKELALRSGDTLGIFSEWRYLSRLEKQKGFAVVTTEYPRERYVPHKRWLAVSCLLVALALVLFTPIPAGIGLLTGAVGMMITGVLEVEEAYQAVSWKTIFLLAGLIPFGMAMQSTGTAGWLAQGLTVVCHHLTVLEVLIVLAVLTTLASLLMSNIGSAVVLVPIAMQLASALGDDPRQFAILTAIAASNMFILPTHQVNTLISGPGGYRTQDFVKIGTIVSVLYLLVLVPMVYYVY